MKKYPTVSLVVCTYNWKEALRLSLLSATQQSVLPTEIVVADDGSRADTSAEIAALRMQMPCPLYHVWQEDRGFRRAAIMNKAFARCTSDYIVQIDGDIIMDPYFIEDHLKAARPQMYLPGSRAKLTAKRSAELLAGAVHVPLHWWSKGVTRRENAIRIGWLSRLLSKIERKGHERGCNISFWRKDLYAVNGYDGRMEGYGHEDIDLTLRLRRNGVQRGFLKFAAVQYHLFHREGDVTEWPNEDLYAENVRTGLVVAPYGIQQHLEENAATDTPR